MVAHRDPPERTVDEFYFTERGHFAVCDDGTVWELVGIVDDEDLCKSLRSGVPPTREWRWEQLPAVPGTEPGDGSKTDAKHKELEAVLGTLRDMKAYAAPETWGDRIKGLISDIEKMVGDE